MPSPVDTPARSPRLRQAAWLLGALLVVGLCLVPTLGFGLLAWDDRLHVTDNPAVTRPWAAGWRTLLLTPQLGYPIPVTVLSYALDYALFGANPLGFHLSQALYQLAVCALYFALSRALGLSLAACALAVVCFALHPATAEPVSWISGRKDLLAAFWGLATLRLSLYGTARARSGALACYALALLSKPSAAPVAALAVLTPELFGPAYRRARVRELPWRAILLRAVPYALLLVPSVLLGVRGQAGVGALVQTTGQISRWRAAWYALGHHLSVLFLWEPTTAKYLPARWPPPFSPRVDLAPALLLLLIAAALISTRSRPQLRRCVWLGVLWAALCYLPSAGLLFPLARYLADSYLYLPLLGAGWVAGALLDSAIAAVRPRFASALRLAPWGLSLLLMPSFLPSSARFADDERLWAQAFARYPHHRRVCRQWANAVAERHGALSGLRATDLCIARFGPELFVRNRAVLLNRLGRTQEAEAWLRASAQARVR